MAVIWVLCGIILLGREGGGRIILLGRRGEVVAILMYLKFNNNNKVK